MRLPARPCAHTYVLCVCMLGVCVMCVVYEGEFVKLRRKGTKGLASAFLVSASNAG